MTVAQVNASVHAHISHLHGSRSVVRIRSCSITAMSASVPAASLPQMPPDLPAAAAPPASTLDQLLQMINLQMQQQQAQQAQVQDMLRRMANAQNASRPGVASVVNNTGPKTWDERHFSRIKIFENQSDAWKEWRTHFLTAVRESSPITAQLLEKG